MSEQEAIERLRKDTCPAAALAAWKEIKGLRWAWLQTLRAWSLCADSIRRELVLAVPEYITEAERERRVAELGAEEWTLEEAAQHLADVDESQDVRGWKAALVASVADGSLVATGKGKSQRIRYSDLCSWQGEEVPVIPELGLEAEVHPDAGVVAMRRGAMDAVRQFLAAAPGGFTSADSPEGENPLDASVQALETTLRNEVPSLCRELKAVDIAIAEVRERLGGEDPLDPELRCSLSGALECLAGLAEQRSEGGLAIELDEPPDGEVQKYREVLRSFVKQETGW